MASADRGIAFLDSMRSSAVIHGDQIPWERYLQPEDKSRIIPAESLAEAGLKRLMLAPEKEEGLTLPWQKTHDSVLIRPGKLAVWAGWTHHGKTQMVKQAMLHGIANGELPLIASMEEEVVDVWSDMASMACGSQEPQMRDAKRFVEFVRGKLWLFDQQGMIDSRKIQAVIRYAAAELKITQAVIDSLMMLSVDRDDYEAQARFVGELKTTAKDTGVTIHLVAHMRKRDGKGGMTLRGRFMTSPAGMRLRRRPITSSSSGETKSRMRIRQRSSKSISKGEGRTGLGRLVSTSILALASSLRTCIQ